MQPNNNPINNSAQINSNLRANSDEEINQQGEGRLNGIGRAIVSIANNAYEFVASISPLYGVAPHPAGQVNVAWDNIDLQGIALEVLRHIPGIGGTGVAVNNAARVLQLFMMMRAAQAASGNSENTDTSSSTTEGTASTSLSPSSAAQTVIEISTAEELAQMANSSGHFRLTRDINAGPSIGDISGFSGTLDGNGFTITGLEHPLFIDLRGEVSDLTINETIIIVKEFAKDQVSYPSIGALACDTYDAKITNVTVRNSGLEARHDNHQSFAGCVVGRNFGDSTFENITVIDCKAKAEGVTNATAGGVLGAHINGTLTAEALRVHRGYVWTGATKAIGAGAIGDVGTGCNQAGGELTCNNISTDDCNVQSFGERETQNTAIAAGILTGNANTIEGCGFSVNKNMIFGDCQEAIIGSLDNCTATTPPPHQASNANSYHGTTRIVQTVAPLPVESSVAINAAFAASYASAFVVGAASFFFASSYLQAYRSGARGQKLAMAPFRQLSNVLSGRQSNDLYDGELEAVMISQSDLSTRDKRRMGMRQGESQFLVIEEGSKDKNKAKVQANSHSACGFLNKAKEKVTSCFAGSNLNRDEYIKLINRDDGDENEEFFDAVSCASEQTVYTDMTPGAIRRLEQSTIASRREQPYEQPDNMTLKSSQLTFIQPSSEAVQEGFDNPNTPFAYSNPAFEAGPSASTAPSVSAQSTISFHS